MQYQTITSPEGGKSHLYLCVIVLFIISIFGTASQGAVLYVDIGNSSGTENGTGWATAFTSIQDAVDASGSGDEIWVASGTYTGAGEYVVEMAEGVALYGGFAGTETQRSQRNLTLNPTTIDGETERKVLRGADNASLDGFTITRGGNYIYGGGMYNKGEFLNELSLSISNCSFLNNHAISGGAIYSDSADIEVNNCTFDQNGGLQGGAVYTMNSAPTFTYCIFTDNNAANRGGAMVNQSSDAAVSNCQFIGNSVEYVMNASTGGAVYNQYSRSVFTNTIFRDNEADGFGGGIYTDGSGYAPTITNCTFRDNEAGDQGGAIFNKECDSVITNCILWDDSAENQGDEIYNDNSSPVITYCCIDGYFPGTGNLNSDPYFVSATDLKLQEESPCIDTATAAGAPDSDIAGHPRPIGSGYDMGAYEMPEVINDDVLEDQDRIVFPAGFSSFGPLLSNTWVGATAMNINSSSKPITFFGKDPQGNTISTNDSLDPLVGRGQLANLTTELVPYNSQISTLIGEGNGAQLPLRGIFVIGDSQTSRLDGIGHRWTSGKELYLLNGWEKTGQSTIVFLYNPDMSVQANITLDWTAEDGSVIDTYSGTLPPEGTLAQSLSTLFSSANDSLEGYLKVTSSTEICGFIAHATQQSIIAFPARAPAETDALYAPHFILLPDGTGSDLQVVNAGFNAASIVFTAIDDSGTEYPSQQTSLQPGEMLKGPITDFVPLDPGSLAPTQILTGRIRVEISPESGMGGATPMLLGGITLATGPGNSAGLPLEKEGWKETVFPHIAQSNALRIYTGLAIWNTSPYNSYVTVRARNQQGQVTAAKAFTLPSGQRKVNLLNEDVYFGGEFSQVGGHLEVISTQEIIAFCLYGDFDLVYLSTIGGQKVE